MYKPVIKASETIMRQCLCTCCRGRRVVPQTKSPFTSVQHADTRLLSTVNTARRPSFSLSVCSAAGLSGSTDLLLSRSGRHPDTLTGRVSLAVWSHDSFSHDPEFVTTSECRCLHSKQECTVIILLFFTVRGENPFTTEKNLLKNH